MKVMMTMSKCLRFDQMERCYVQDSRWFDFSTAYFSFLIPLVYFLSVIGCQFKGIAIQI